MKKDRIWFYLILTTFLIIIYFIIKLYFGWYGYRKWEYRQDTTSPRESIQRGVFVKKLNFAITPDSLMKNYKDQDTLFYIEKGYTWGYFSMNDTRVLSAKETKYPFQLIRRGIDVVYLERDNLKIQDSVTHFPILLKSTKNDTIYFKLLKRKSQNIVDTSLTDTIGIVKVY